MKCAANSRNVNGFSLLGFGLSLEILFLLACLVWPASQARAEEVAGAPPTDPALIEKVRKANAECYACHTEEGLKNPPRAGMDLARLQLFIRDPQQFDQSNHANMDCKVCHGQAYAAFPHPPDAKDNISPCEECHAQKSLRVEKQFDKSVHAVNLKDKFTCVSCHDPHVYKVAQKIGDPRAIVTQDNAMCIDCHNSDLRYGQFAAALPKSKVRPDLDKLHSWLPNAGLHWSAVRCIECHTPVSKVKSLATSHEIQGKDQAEKNCVTCHSQDSALATRLYRFAAANAGADLGFQNSAILGSAYVVGASRNPLIDNAVLALFALVSAALAGHGALRIIATLVRRRRSS